MNQIELKALLEKYLGGNCSPEEIILLESWYTSQAKQTNIPQPDEEELHSYKNAIWAGIMQNKKTRRPWPILLTAASVLLAMSFSGYLFFKEQPKKTFEQKIVKKDFLPGPNKAVLILSNGKTVSLTDTNMISFARGSDILSGDQAGYNTIKTPGGGQWPAIELPDGTKVFLDAASSISFPVSLNQERKVSLTGQAYFQVKHDEKKPFLITVKGLIIEDLGTDFNVNAFDDESHVTTTLIEGSLSISKKNQKIILTPGQQAITDAGKGPIITKAADMEEVMAWKNGLFQFSHTPIDVVMRQIARWYDVDIIYKGDVSHISFTGNLPRNLKASRLLEMLSITGLNFTIEGNSIIVSSH